MYGFNVVEMGHVFPILAPIAASTALTSGRFSMENWNHASIIVHAGAGSALTITMYECSGAGGTGATSMGFRYAEEGTASGDVTDAALAAATSAGVATSTATGVYWIIELDADQLTDGYPWVQVNFSDPGTSKLISAVAVLSGGRYQKDITASVAS